MAPSRDRLREGVSAAPEPHHGRDRWRHARAGRRWRPAARGGAAGEARAFPQCETSRRRAVLRAQRAPAAVDRRRRIGHRIAHARAADPVRARQRSQPARRAEDAVLHPAGRPQRRGQAAGYRAPDDGAREHLREGRGRPARLPFLADAGRRHGARAARHTAHHPGPAGPELRRARARAARQRGHSRRGAIAGAGRGARSDRATDRASAAGGRGIRHAGPGRASDHGRDGRGPAGHPVAGGPLGAHRAGDPLHHADRPGADGGGRPGGDRPLQPHIGRLHPAVRRAGRRFQHPVQRAQPGRAGRPAGPPVGAGRRRVRRSARRWPSRPPPSVRASSPSCRPATWAWPSSEPWPASAWASPSSSPSCCCRPC